MAVQSSSSQALPRSSASNLPSSSHRLPTVSATEALKGLRSKGPRAVLTGLKQLDALLGGVGGQKNGLETSSNRQGLVRGSVTEIWGPAGSGKTTCAMQAAANVLKGDGAVVWLDAAAPIFMPRFTEMLTATSERKDVDSLTSNLHQFTAPALAHLIALTLHPPSWFPPVNTELLIIDGLHNLLDIAYPRYTSSDSATKNEAAKRASGRRYSILSTLMSTFKKLAALHDMAILITTGCATRMRPGTGLGAILVPGLTGMEWDNGITNRLVTFRDFATPQSRHASQENGRPVGAKSARYIGVQKLHGSSIAEEGDVGHVVRFEIDETGLRDIASLPADMEKTEDALSSLPRPVLSPVKARKRKHDEVADSEDEISSEYGWLAEDEVAAEGMIDDRALAEEETGKDDGDTVGDKER